MINGLHDHWREPPPSNPVSTLLAIAVVIAAFGMMVYGCSARAHDYAHPERQKWYESLRSNGGAPCCDGKDASHVADIDWDTSCEQNNFGETHCHYRVFLHNKWIDVPATAVVDGPNRDGSALVWEIPQLSGDSAVDATIRCFMPGAGG